MTLLLAVCIGGLILCGCMIIAELVVMWVDRKKEP